MTKVLHLRPGSDEFEIALAGLPRAERINDIVARPDSQRHRDYAALIEAQANGEPELDPGDAYREDADRWQLIGRALRAYLRRDHTDDPKAVKGGLVYVGDGVCSAPHAVDSGLIAIQVHIRTSLKLFQSAVDRWAMDPETLDYAQPPELYRVSQAQMIVCGLPYAMHLDYFCAPDGTEHIADHVVRYDERRAGELVAEMARFAERVREAA